MRLDEAYQNAAHIPNGEGYYAAWTDKAAAFRDSHDLKELGLIYGVGRRQFYDIYHPGQSAKGTVVFVHGGYWMACAPSDFSHLAAGAVAAGYACAMPSYTLAPEARISDITAEIAAMLDAVTARTSGPLFLVGHSAGGHLVARMGCPDRAGLWADRIERIMAISPLGDLAPLMETSMNATLRIDAAEAEMESPVRHDAPACPVTVWVGAAERPAFLDQAAGLAGAWDAEHVVEPERHHFDVIDGLETADSPMMRALFS